MKCFQVLNERVLIINEEKQYEDSLDNFTRDSGIIPQADRILYDNQQKFCVIGEEFKEYPNADFDGYIAAVQTYIDAKTAREYVPPTLAELKTQAMSHQYALYVAQKNATVWLTDGSGYGFDCDDASQKTWQIALTLAGDTGCQFKVWVSTESKKLATVTKTQMIAAGEAARAQQLSAYSDFEEIKRKIQKIDNEADLKPYLD